MQSENDERTKEYLSPLGLRLDCRGPHCCLRMAGKGGIESRVANMLPQGQAWCRSAIEIHSNLAPF